MSNLCDIIQIIPYKDKRGLLKKVYAKSQSQDQKEIEEVYLLYSNKDSIRGNHYHTRTSEYFTVVTGRAKVAVKDLFKRKYEEFYLSHSDDAILRILHLYPMHSSMRMIIRL